MDEMAWIMKQSFAEPKRKKPGVMERLKARRESQNDAAKAARLRDAKSPVQVELRRAQKRDEEAGCCTPEWLAQFCRRDGECLIWTGPFRASFGRVLPEVRRGRYGQMYAHKAMWAAARHGSKIRRGNWISTTCGNDSCVEPSHMYETCRPLARILKATSPG